MKKKIPLAVLQSFQPVADNNKHLVKSIPDENSMFHLVDIDPKSDFYFKMVKQELRTGRLAYMIEYKPRSSTSVAQHSVWLNLDGIMSSAKGWLALLSEYNSIKTIHDDPILEEYQKHFEKQLEIFEEDADILPFNIEQQLFLEEYLNTAKAKIIGFKESGTEDEVKALTEIEEDIIDIQKTLTQLPKKKVVKKLARVFAKCQKIGLGVVKDIFINVTAQIVAKLITGA